MPLPGYMERSIKAQLRDNKFALFAAIQKLAAGSDTNTLLALLCESHVPIGMITEGFNIDIQKLIEIRRADPIAIVSCVECQDHLADDNLGVFHQQMRTLRYLGRFAEGALVERDRLYELMCAVCADQHRDDHAEQLRIDLLARKKRNAEVKRIARDSLEAYYRTPEWKARSNRKKIAAGNRCQVCGHSNVPLEVHHNNYHRLGSELLEDLIVLCRDCHQLYHDHKNLPGAA